MNRDAGPTCRTMTGRPTRIGPSKTPLISPPWLRRRSRRPRAKPTGAPTKRPGDCRPINSWWKRFSNKG
jgi:hypothetical protein